jgi:hypothetical protein
MADTQLSEADQATILAAARNGQSVSEDLQKKLFEHVKAGHPSSFAAEPAYDPNYFCCNPGQSPPDTYQWTTFDDCRMMGGTAATLFRKLIVANVSGDHWQIPNMIFLSILKN